tara:strand:+ start:680 stop:1255 length:576 start_codon:yes stop_codon:yes gene_type:complete
MNKKIAFQITLFLFLLIIIFFFYYKYFFLKESKIDLPIQNQKNEILESNNNVIKNIRYFSTDKQGNEYLITSKYGEISSKDSNIILMKNVTSQINLFERDTIYITSKFAEYNSLNFDTNFNQDVILEYSEHKINSENMDLSFKKNFVEMYDNIIYKSPTNELFADKLEIDLLTKDSKIFMLNNEKIIIFGK